MGVFAALVRDRARALVDGELFVPEHWFADPERCQAAGMPDTLACRTKGEIALDLLLHLRREGLRYSHVLHAVALNWKEESRDRIADQVLVDVEALVLVVGGR